MFANGKQARQKRTRRKPKRMGGEAGFGFRRASCPGGVNCCQRFSWGRGSLRQRDQPIPFSAVPLFRDRLCEFAEGGRGGLHQGHDTPCHSGTPVTRAHDCHAHRRQPPHCRRSGRATRNFRRGSRGRTSGKSRPHPEAAHGRQTSSHGGRWHQRRARAQRGGSRHPRNEDAVYASEVHRPDQGEIDWSAVTDPARNDP